MSLDSSTILDVCRSLEPTVGPVRTIKRNPSGNVNEVYCIATSEKRYALKMPGRNATLLGASWNREVEHAQVAAKAGIAPTVVRVSKRPDFLLTSWQDGVDLRGALPQFQLVESMGVALSRLHSLQGTSSIFFPSRLIEEYLSTGALLGCSLEKPHGEDTVRLAQEISQALARKAKTRVFSHNDLFPSNWIRAENDGLFIIDYEFSGQNDPLWDLGTIVNEFNLDQEGQEVLCHAYLRRVPPRVFMSRLALYLIVEDTLWSLYSNIQQALGVKRDLFKEMSSMRSGRIARRLENQDIKGQLARLG